MIDAIGGYFGLEQSCAEHYHATALRLNTARNCLEYILLARQYKHIYLPAYTCDVLLEPLQKHNVRYTFYPVTMQLEPAYMPDLKHDEALLYTNYFGLKQDCMDRLARQYGSQLIADNAQAFYAQPIAGIDTFYSPRKFFGVPDGAYLYTDAVLTDDLEQDVSWQRASHLLTRIDCGAETGYEMYVRNNATLHNQPMRHMSQLTEAMLAGVDYGKAADVRRENFLYLQRNLVHHPLHLSLPEDAVPMVYPYYTEDISLRKRLAEQRIYTAKYWQCVHNWSKDGDVAADLTEHLIPLPCDQRYGVAEMDKIVQIIRNHD